MADNEQAAKFQIAFVIKRKRFIQLFDEEKLNSRICLAIRDHERSHVDVARIMTDVMKAAYPVIAADELDCTLAAVCARLSHIHPAYDKVAGRIAMGSIHKETPSLFSEAVQAMFQGHPTMFTTMYIQSANALMPYLDEVVVDNRDFDLAYDAVLLYRKHFLMKWGGRLLERPQYTLMRLAIAINGSSLKAVRKTYSLLSKGRYLPEPAAMIYAGTTSGQMISRYSLDFGSNEDMSRFIKLTECSMTIYGGGSVAVGVSNFPSAGEIHNGYVSAGLQAVIRVFDDVVHRIGKGVGPSRGKVILFLEPWHSEVLVFVRRNIQTFVEHDQDGRGLHFGLWVSDLFMQRVESGGDWSLFRPGDVPELVSSSGTESEKLYREYETRGIAVRTVPARELWEAIIDSVLSSGGPLIMFKDSVNAKSNFSHLGTLQFGGNGADTALPVSLEETGLCNTASVVLPVFVRSQGVFSYSHLHRVVKSVTRDLNRMLFVNHYPSMPATMSYMQHRAIGIGILGLADTFMAMRIPYESDKAIEIGTLILETIYHAALEASCDLVDVYGRHPSFQNSPLSEGYFQFDLWKSGVSNDRYDWSLLRDRIRRRGVVNAQVVVLSDTASSSRLTTFTEGFEPLLGNVVLKGSACAEYVALNANLVSDLEALGLWDENLRCRILSNCGSLRTISEIPADLKDIYKCAWEISTDIIIRHAVARGPFVCQSQSLTLYSEVPNSQWLNNSIFAAWKGGLKTGSYLVRGRRRPVEAADSSTADT